MFFSPQIGLKPLSSACRLLSTMLHSGVDIGKSFETVGRKSRDPRCQRAMKDVRASIRRGSDVASAMQEQDGAFPELVIDMVNVAEHTGFLPEVLQSLADHYDNTLRLRRDLITSLIWPAIQLLAAIFIIAFMIFILGMIAAGSGSKPIDYLGLGLNGTEGAITWLTFNFGTLFGIWVLFMVGRRSLLGQRAMDTLLLKIPVIGKCMQAFAIARFSWSFALTQQAGMSIQPSLETSFRATGNGAFIGAYPQVWAMVQAGEPLAYSLAESRLFPEEFLSMVEVAETSGTVPEMLDRLSSQFEEQARRAMAAMTTVLGWVIWGMVAVFIIFLIFRIILTYLNMLQSFMP